MSTAQEIELKAAEVAPRLAALTHRIIAMAHDLAIYGMHVAIGREVCARRARKLWKRGEDVRYSGRTKNGKTRYTWTKRLPSWAIYRPNA